MIINAIRIIATLLAIAVEVYLFDATLGLKGAALLLLGAAAGMILLYLSRN